MKEKILVTGGSGFIGTNLVEYFLAKNFDVRNIDINEPKIPRRKDIWKKVDICNYKELERTIREYNPNYIIHLAARTDLDGKSISDYSANTVGVENLLSIISKMEHLKKVIITSSKLVTKNGYKVQGQFDYLPDTLYGESKVETEKKVWENKPCCDWCIIRPTSIWGPWFGIPYRNFFDMVIHHMYFHIGNTKCYKTYGYIGNSVHQIEQLLFSLTEGENNKVFYIGDEPAYEINEWADEIAEQLGYKIPTMPVILIKLLAWFGDFLKIFRIHFPMQSFRFHNMTTDNTNDVSNTMRIAPNLQFTRREGIRITLQWMKSIGSK